MFVHTPFHSVVSYPIPPFAHKPVTTDEGRQNLKEFIEEKEDMPKPGDLKYSVLSVDHDGWFLLDGRTIAELPDTAAGNAAQLGFATSIPDAADCVYFGTDWHSQTGTVVGDNERTIDRSMLPVESLTVTVDSAGEHTHTYDHTHNHGNYVNVILTPNNYPVPQYYAGTVLDTNLAGDHTHTAVTEPLNSGGTQNAFSVLPKTLVANAFLYLG